MDIEEIKEGLLNLESELTDQAFDLIEELTKENESLEESKKRAMNKALNLQREKVKLKKENERLELLSSKDIDRSLLEKLSLLKYPIKLHWHNGATVEHPPKQVDVNKYKRAIYLKGLIDYIKNNY
jgi:hypothetical protein